MGTQPLAGELPTACCRVPHKGVHQRRGAGWPQAPGGLSAPFLPGQRRLPVSPTRSVSGRFALTGRDGDPTYRPRTSQRVALATVRAGRFKVLVEPQGAKRPPLAWPQVAGAIQEGRERRGQGSFRHTRRSTAAIPSIRPDDPVFSGSSFGWVGREFSGNRPATSFSLLKPSRSRRLTH